MSISMDDVKKLRDQTGVSVMQCKKALEEAEGDMEKALMVLRKKSSDIAAKKADRETKAGAVVVKETDGKAIVVNLFCETDFVAKNEDFTKLANMLADKAADDSIATVQAEATDMIEPFIQKLGENIQLGPVEEISGGVIGSYVHNNQKAAVVALSGGDETLAKDIAMHVAAMNPQFKSRDEIPAEVQDQAKEMFEKEVAEEDKPEDIKAKILEGKINSYFKEQTLLDQSFVKDPSKTIETLLKENGAAITAYALHIVG
jgi:elongation factor Ts